MNPLDRLDEYFECDAHASEVFGTDWEESWCPICERQDQEGEAKEPQRQRNIDGD